MVININKKELEDKLKYILKGNELFITKITTNFINGDNKMGQLLLGNLTVNQMIEQLGINITNEEKELLENMRCDSANSIPKDKFHCFDMPFVIHAGSKSVCSKLYDILSKYQNDIICSIKVEII